MSRQPVCCCAMLFRDDVYLTDQVVGCLFLEADSAMSGDCQCVESVICDFQNPCHACGNGTLCLFVCVSFIAAMTGS